MVKYNEDFATEGWFAEPVEYDLGDIQVPFFPIYLDDDTTCEYQLARDIAQEIPSLAESHTYHDGTREHLTFTAYQDINIYNVVKNMLESVGDNTIADDCSAIDFSVWTS